MLVLLVIPAFSAGMAAKSVIIATCESYVATEIETKGFGIFSLQFVIHWAGVRVSISFLPDHRSLLFYWIQKLFAENE